MARDEARRDDPADGPGGRLRQRHQRASGYCGKGPAPATASFTVMGLAFRYPVSWQRSRTWEQRPYQYLDIDRLSEQEYHRLRAPCAPVPALAESPRPATRSVSCRAGVLVRWSANGFSAWRMPKANTTIAGRKAAEEMTSGGWCAPLRATKTITVIIRESRPAPGTRWTPACAPPACGTESGGFIVHARSGFR